jgi:hypothetical protein
VESQPVPRYFFNVQDGQDLPDHEGTVLAGPDAARVMAVFTSGEMLKSHAEKFWLDRDWQMHVTDEQGATVCDLRFSGTAGAP